MDYTPHFTVGNMKRTLDVVAATGEKIVALWADPYVFALKEGYSQERSKTDEIGLRLFLLLRLRIHRKWTMCLEATPRGGSSSGLLATQNRVPGRLLQYLLH